MGREQAGESTAVVPGSRFEHEIEARVLGETAELPWCRCSPLPVVGEGIRDQSFHLLCGGGCRRSVPFVGRHRPWPASHELADAADPEWLRRNDTLEVVLTRSASHKQGLDTRGGSGSRTFALMTFGSSALGEVQLKLPWVSASNRYR